MLRTTKDKKIVKGIKFKPSVDELYLKSKKDEDLVHESLELRGFDETLIKKLFREGKTGDIAVLYKHCLMTNNLLTEGFLPTQIINILARHGGEAVLKYVLDKVEFLKRQCKSIDVIVDFACVQNVLGNLKVFCEGPLQPVYDLGYDVKQIIYLLSKASMAGTLQALIEYTPKILSASPGVQVIDIYNEIKDSKTVKQVRDTLERFISLPVLQNRVHFAYTGTPLSTTSSDEEKNLIIDQFFEDLFPHHIPNYNNKI